MSAFPFTDRDRFGGRTDGLSFSALLVLAIASALTGAVVALAVQRVAQRRQLIEVLPPPTPIRRLEASASTAVQASAAGTGGSGRAAPLGAVSAKLSAARVAELERLLAADDVIAGDGSATCPPEFPIKANGRSGIYHWPGAFAYAQTRPTLCFTTTDAAERAGFRPALR
jgi:hypothetical protein